jgi:hypothetical protein
MFWVEVLDKPCFLLSHGGHRFLEAEGFPGGSPGDLLGVSWGSSGVSWCLLGSPGAWCKEQGLAKSSALIVRSRGACDWPCPECERPVHEYALRALLPYTIAPLQRASLDAVAAPPDCRARVEGEVVCLDCGGVGAYRDKEGNKRLWQNTLCSRCYQEQRRGVGWTFLPRN